MNNQPIEPMKEIVAYEKLWSAETASYKRLSELFMKHPGSRPSDFVNLEGDMQFYQTIKEIVLKDGCFRTNILINGTLDYPSKLKDAKVPIEILYYTGNLDLLSTRSVAIVGTRNPTPEGLIRASNMVRFLVKDGFTIVSGLAKGIDTQAHKTALEEKGKTIAVIGTPLDKVYPKENRKLQDYIALEHLLITQVPFYRYRQQGIHGNRLFFPERNKTMSALTEATIIIEAGETSGTLVQARAALQQGRKLFILDSCFQNKAITWPEKFLKQGAIRVKEYADVQKALK